MKKYIRVKSWILKKKNKYGYCSSDIRNGYKFDEFSKFGVVKETEKAFFTKELEWIPKSAIIEVIEEAIIQCEAPYQLRGCRALTELKTALEALENSGIDVDVNQLINAKLEHFKEIRKKIKYI